MERAKYDNGIKRYARLIAFKLLTTLPEITDIDLNSFYADNESSRKEMNNFVEEFSNHINK